MDKAPELKIALSEGDGLGKADSNPVSTLGRLSAWASPRLGGGKAVIL
ncbi:MAG TPA: hypothetical protein PKE22_09820 [Ottowia sp.]|jgi:hypothetical protein|nr:hypothetical protein [Ottowia sp.]HMT65135.1 hypothetical protein [Ottowia sp.]HOK13032.1 hypothetical protein [Ottowia sp.]HPP98298.1 hypothetical protein [Ottowia sp.]HQX67282.1 hypothetical protein [Ottowia sp.]